MGENLNGHVISATRDNFEQSVIARSSDTLVVVDFWAEWCGPCRLLGPVLERLASEYGGRFLLVKANTEELPDIAAGFGVRSIPAVFALRGGKAVDMFVGVQPEAAIRAWIDRLLPTPAEAKSAEAARLESTDPGAAEAGFRAALELDKGLTFAKIGLARVLAASGRDEEARSLITELNKRGFLEPEAERIQAELALREQAETAGSVPALRAKVAVDPRDYSARLRLAEVLAAAGTYDEALGLCLDLVERDRKSTGEEARKTMLSIFQLLPPESELAADYRRKLSVALS
jgi:putative thioredoxin